MQNVNYSVYKISAHHRRADYSYSLIPDSAIVSTQQFLAPRLFAKKGMMIFPRIENHNGTVIADYFYLDLSFPFLVKLMNMGEKRIAVRFSEYESVETCLSLTGKVDWVWVDCFTRFPMDQECYHKLSRYFKICLVSPELVGRESEIEKVREAVDGMEIDAVCTKVPEKWSDLAYHKSVFCQK